MSELTRTAVTIDRSLLERFDGWLAARGYTNRSEAVRDLVREALVSREWENPEAVVVATLSIVFDHEAQELAQQLTHLQHAEHHCILCSQHVHLDHHNCLESIVMKGKPAQLRKLADAILATKGVRMGELTLLSQSL